MLSAILDFLAQLCPCRRCQSMDCSIARQSRFPFFFPSIWSSRRSQQDSAVSVSTQTQTPAAPAVPKMGITSTLQRRSTERERSNRDAAKKDVTDGIERLVGLDNVKRQLNGVQSYVQICRRHGRDPRSEWYNIAMQGNPGTGMLLQLPIHGRFTNGTRQEHCRSDIRENAVFDRHRRRRDCEGDLGLGAGLQGS